MRQITRLLVVAAGAAVIALPLPATAQASGWRTAVERLVRERTLAEGCASILKTFADDRPMARVQGQRLYARAKADVDGLIALLPADLAGDRSPAEIPALRRRLEGVPKQRRALCRQVRATIEASAGEPGEGTSGPLDLLIRGSSDAGGSLVEAIVEIWRAYRGADAARRQAIALELETARWLPYERVPRHGS